MGRRECEVSGGVGRCGWRGARLAALAALVFAGVGLVGCPGGEPPPGTDGWSYTDDEDAGPDGGGVDDPDGADGTDGGPAWSGDEPFETTFQIENRTGGPIRVQAKANCESEPPGWLSVSHAERDFDLATSCRTCFCSEIDDGQPCTVCGACTAPKVEEVPPDQRESWTWTGTAYLNEQIDGNSCHRRAVPPRGATMEAELCWSATSGPTGSGESLEDPTCESVEFTYGDDQVVRAAAEADREPKSRTFRLVNESDSDVRIQSVDECFQHSPGWMSVEQEGEEVELDTNCKECECSSIGPDSPCGGCAIACVTEKRVEQLAAGDAVEWNWSGRIYEQDQVDGQSCVRPRVPASQKSFTVEFCWSEESGPTGDDVTLEDPTCKEKSFDYGDDGPVELKL